MRSVLEYLRIDVSGDVADTPVRAVKALQQMTSGYTVDVHALLKCTFEVSTPTDVIAVNDISFASLCEHHLMPFTGQAQVAYAPSADSKVVGLSKIPRLVHAFAKRLQMQERMTQQIAEALFQAVAPLGVAVRVDAQHSCMACRGVEQRGATMRTVTVVGGPNDVVRRDLLSALQIDRYV